MKNHVEVFTDHDMYALETKINTFCSQVSYNPISISVFRDGLSYIAFVIVEEGDS